MKSRSSLLALSLLCVCAIAKTDGNVHDYTDGEASYSIVWAPGQEFFGGLYEQPWLGAPNATLQIKINGQPINKGEDNGIFNIMLPDGRRKRIRLLFHDRPNDPFFHKAGMVILERCGYPENGVYVDCTQWQEMKPKP